MMTASIFLDSFLATFGFVSAIAVCGFIVFIVFIVIELIAKIFGKKEDKKEDKKDGFDWTYQDEKCFHFAYDKDDNYKLVRISKDKLKSLIEDKNIDLYYSEESK